MANIYDGALTSALSGQVNNPYLNQQAGTITRQVNDNLQNVTLPGIGNGATSAGQYGGSRQGIAQGMALSRAQGDLSQGLSSLYGNAYESAQNRQASAATTMAGIDNQRAIADQANATNRYGMDTTAATSRYNTDAANKTNIYGIDQNNATNRYTADLGAQTSRYGVDTNAATNRYGVDTNAQTSRYGTDVGASTNRYGVDTNADTSRYGTDVNNATALSTNALNNNTSRYGTDVNASTNRYGTDANNATAVSTNTLNNATSRYGADVNALTQTNALAQNNSQFGQNLDHSIYNDTWNQNNSNLQTGIGLLGTLNGYNQNDLANGTTIQNTPLNYYGQLSDKANSIGQGYGASTGMTGYSSSPLTSALGGAQLGSSFGNALKTGYGNLMNSQGYGASGNNYNGASTDYSAPNYVNQMDSGYNIYGKN